MRERAALHLALAALPGIGPVSAAQLMTGFGSIEALARGRAPVQGWASLPSDLERRLGRAFPDGVAYFAGRPEEPPGWHRALIKALHRALPRGRDELQRAEGRGLSVVCREDPAYPPSLLAGLGAPPSVLFVAGTLPVESSRPFPELAALAVVGARAASRYSLAFARDLAAEVAGRGVVVVSGLALGVDAAAHEGALETGTTVAVLGSGHGRLHPRSHTALAQRIADAGGAVVSEWPPDTNPQPGNFPWRNRIISGLSRAVAVIEASLRSGALSTVEHALAQGRHVLAVPDRPDSRRAAGNLSLIRDGATPLIDASDALALFPDVVAKAAAGAERRKDPLEEALAGGGWHAPEHLASRLGQPVAVLLASLTTLELDGKVTSEAGQYRLSPTRSERV